MRSNHSSTAKGNPAKQSDQNNKTAVVQTVSTQWAGPLPPPAVLGQFNDVVPNGAERIMAMAEKEQSHRIKYESDNLKQQSIDTKIGMLIGGVALLGCIAGSVYTAIIGSHPAVSIALVSAPVMAVVLKFVINKYKN